MPTPGGQSWSDVVLLGSERDAFQLMHPDIRMPANQSWPLHWHELARTARGIDRIAV